MEKINYAFGKTIDFSDFNGLYEVYEVISEFRGFFARKIENYKTAKCFDKTYLSASDEDDVRLVDFSKVNQNDVIEIRHQTRISNKYKKRNEIIIYITSITDDCVEFEYFNTIFKAIKYKNGLLKK